MDLRRQMKFTFPLNTREDPNCGFESWEVLPPSILQIVLKGTHFLKNFVWLPHGHLWAIIGERLTYLILIIMFYLFWPKDHWEPCNKVGSLHLTEGSAPSGDWTEKLPILDLNPLGLLQVKLLFLSYGGTNKELCVSRVGHNTRIY